MAKPKQYSDRIQVVVTPDEGKRIKQLADSANLSLSGFCKQLILAAINQPEDTTQLLPIDTTQATTLDTTYVTTLDAANEYSKLWEAVNNLTKEYLTIREEVNTLVTTLATTALEPGTILTTEQLVDRLKDNILAQSSAKTDKGRLAVINAYPETLNRTKLNRLAAMTAKVDPNGYTWQPTDESRQLWVMQAS
ncbi:MAG: hypothetical protein V7K35_12405 [Nostoc sp.]|uniref:hypothetical protein n=1 Tax=Nostoc sp. TaxID=1180 RepID=UPI002FFD2CB6